MLQIWLLTFLHSIKHHSASLKKSNIVSKFMKCHFDSQSNICMYPVSITSKVKRDKPVVVLNILVFLVFM